MQFDQEIYCIVYEFVYFFDGIVYGYVFGQNYWQCYVEEYYIVVVGLGEQDVGDGQVDYYGIQQQVYGVCVQLLQVWQWQFGWYVYQFVGDQVYYDEDQDQLIGMYVYCVQQVVQWVVFGDVVVVFDGGQCYYEQDEYQLVQGGVEGVVVGVLFEGIIGFVYLGFYWKNEFVW